MGISNLFDAGHLVAHTAVQDALHAHVLLRRDVDYVVNDDAVLSVDEIKGRIVSDRRWPAGLQTALECKEGVGLRAQGRVLRPRVDDHGGLPAERTASGPREGSGARPRSPRAGPRRRA